MLISEATYSLGKVQKWPQPFLGTGILLQHIERVPPHLSFVHNNRLFTLTVKGPRVLPQAQRFLNELGVASYPCVLIRLKGISELADPEPVFRSYAALGSTKAITCLQPIKDFLGHTYANDLSSCEWIKPLYENLKHNGQIESVHSNQVAQTETELRLPVYSMKEIWEEIQSQIQNA